MLQSSKTQSQLRSEPAPETLSPADAFQSAVGFLQRQYPVVIFITLLTLAFGLTFLLAVRPSYIAEAQLLIDAPKVQVFQQQSIFADNPIDTAQVESQVEILKSTNIAAAVIKKLHLTSDSEFVGPSGGLLGVLFRLVHTLVGSSTPPSEYELDRAATSAFQRKLSVSRVYLSYVINIDFRSYDPQRAAEIANAVADAYIVDRLDAKYQTTRRASVWLQDRIQELRDQVSAAEQAVVDFKAKHHIVSTGGTDRPLLSQQQVAELNSQLVVVRAQTAEAKARLDRINSVLKTDAPDASLDATVADTLKSDVVSKLREKYLELAAREADWSALYGPNHLAVVNLRNQMRELNKSIFSELKRLGQTYTSDYDIAKQREQSIENALAQAVSNSQETDVASVSLRQLESTAQTYKSLYDNFLQRYMDAVQQESFPITEARLISAASRPSEKSDPNSRIVLVLAGLGGIILGFGVGILRDLSDRVFRTGEQVESLLGLDCIALLPLLVPVKSPKGVVSPPDDEAAKSKSSTRPGNRLISFGPRTIERSPATWWSVADRPFSRFTEGVRSIKLAADLNGAIKASRVIGLTSSLPEEGKSTVAFSLAQLMAQLARTILVDCDLRNPSLSRMFAPDAKAGLLEVVSGNATLPETMWTEPSTNMAFLPTVMRSRLAHSNEILSSEPMKKLFEKLRQNYDYVVVDLPPLAPIVDVRATTHLVDSFIFVIEWGHTKIEVVKHAINHAEGVRDNLLGVVLNKVNMNGFGRYSGHRESYYSNEHYGRYGYID